MRVLSPGTLSTRVKMTVAEHGKSALTFWHLRERFEEGFSLVDCEIKTGGLTKFGFTLQMIRIQLQGIKPMALRKKEITLYLSTGNAACE